MWSLWGDLRDSAVFVARLARDTRESLRWAASRRFRGRLPELDEHCVVQVLRHLSAHDLASASLVCRSWHRALRSGLASGSLVPRAYRRVCGPAARARCLGLLWLLVAASVPLGSWAITLEAVAMSAASAVALAAHCLRGAARTDRLTPVVVVASLALSLCLEWFVVGLLVGATPVAVTAAGTAASRVVMHAVALGLVLMHSFVFAVGIVSLMRPLCAWAGCAAAMPEYIPDLPPPPCAAETALFFALGAILHVGLQPNSVADSVFRGSLILLFIGLVVLIRTK
eukprot:m51a1_g44 hypothetical protein (284) ;mRNA; r:156607-157458